MQKANANIRQFLVVLCAAAAPLSTNEFLVAQSSGPDATISLINIKNLPDIDSKQTIGARGDGKTDDTAAFQAAADLAKRYSVVLKPDRGSYLGSSPAIYLPAGRYLISDEINLGPYTNIVSDGRAIIEQIAPDKSCFAFHDAYTISIRGIRFLGGKHQLWIDNKNVDSTMLDISECEFQLSNDYAIVTQGTASTTDTHMSAQLMINKCKFIRPRKVLQNVCDYAIIRDTWVQVHQENFDRDSAAFKNVSGVLMFDNMIGVPVFGKVDAEGRQNLDNDGVDRVRWVDNYGTFLVQKSRFGGEFGGIPIVHHFGLPDSKYPHMGQTVCIENSWICAGPASRKDSAVITLRGGVPQLLRIIGNSYLINGVLVRNDGFDVSAFVKSNPHARDRIQFEIRSNMTWPVQQQIPQELRQFLTPK